jgi:hypothetical protein
MRRILRNGEVVGPAARASAFGRGRFVSAFMLGGALFTPYAIFAGFAVPLTMPSLASPVDGAFAFVAAILMVLVAIAATSLLPVVRTLEGVLAPILLGGAAADLVVAPAHTLVERGRTTAWYLLHTVFGAVISLASVVTPTIVILLLSSWMRGAAVVPVGDRELSIDQGWAPLVALGLLMSLVAASWGAGAAAARVAPWLLGRDPVAQLAELNEGPPSSPSATDWLASCTTPSGTP